MKWLPGKDKEPTITPAIEGEQVKKLSQMGVQLASLRQDKGLSLEDLVETTRISRRILQAIEEGNLIDLPEPIYIRSLIRQFADALGINGGEFASHFPIGPLKVSSQATGNNSPIPQLRPIHLYLLYIFLILFSVNSLSQLLNKATLQANNPQVQPTSPIGLVSESSQNIAVNSLSLNNPEKAVQIGVILKSSSWIRVTADGKTEFEGILPQGTYRTWKAQQQLTVKTNNAGGVLMSVNQQAPKEMGAPGKDGEVRIAAKTPS